MQISLSHPSDTQVKVSIVAGEAELEAVKNSVLNRFQKRVRVPGFREGKAPLPMVERSLDQAVLQSEFLDEAINQMYAQAVADKNLRVVSQPQANVTKFVPFTTLEFEAEVEIIGEVKLGDYKKHKKSKPTVKITKDDVASVLSRLQLQQAERTPVERAAKVGDEVMIDFKGVDAKGEPVNGAEGKDYPLMLGSNTFIPGFEDNVVGVKPGEEKTFTIPFPKDYGVAALAGKKVTFTITAKTIQEPQLPEINDEFASKVSPFKTVAELREDIEKQLTEENQRQADQTYTDELVQELAAKTKVAIPASLIDEQVTLMEQEERQNLMYRGQTWQEHLDQEGVTEEEHRNQKRPQAEMRVKVGVMLAEIANAEGITVTPEELEIRMQLLKGQYQDKAMQAELNKPESRRDIMSRLLTEKTVDFLVGNAA